MLKIILIIIAIPIILLLGLFLLIGFMGSGYDKTDLANKAPFKGLAGSEVTLVRPALLAKNGKNFVKANPYLFVVSEDNVYEAAMPRYWLPAGTPIQIDSVQFFRQRMNGYRSIEVLGSTKIPDTGTAVKFEYSWGVENVMPVFEDKPAEWTFPLAPWQDEPITEIYEFEPD